MSLRPGPRAAEPGEARRGPLHRPLPAPPELARQGPLREGAFPSPLHDRYAAAWLGRALGWSFSICFLTGLYSHWAQHPPSWFDLPAHPVWLYRVTQGAHVATGLASVPLLLAKLWTVYPRFWEWPPVRSLAHALERLSLLGLVGGAVFQLLTGIANVYQWYFFRFFFTPTHYFTAWIVMGSLLVHIGTKLTLAQDALAHPERDPHPAGPLARSTALTLPVLRSTGTAPTEPAAPAPTGPPSALDRRWFLGSVCVAAAAVTLTTVGEAVGPLKPLDVLGSRKPGARGVRVPVNKTSGAAGVRGSATSSDYRLMITGQVPSPLVLTLADLDAVARTSRSLPMTCVEGWSVGATWRGVRVRDLLLAAGVHGHPAVRVESLEAAGLYRSSVLGPRQAWADDTLLATHLDGARLDLDHGYPLRLIAPDRPGVLQTKWVHQVVVL